MEVIEKTADLRTRLRELRGARPAPRIGLVPTMGNLHAGHMALVSAARAECEVVVATIFVNPLQFGPNEDYERYPRTFLNDRGNLEAAGCDILFAPSVSEVYPNGLDSQTVISVPELAELHCGASRPGHFNGVATVVCKLFNLVAPDRAYFGQKDYQQLLVIRKMAGDLCMPLHISGVPTQRQPDGLALSSRNGYLSEAEKRIAAGLYARLVETRDRILAGEREFSDLEQAARNLLEEAGMKVDYFSICHAASLLPATPCDHALVILAAVFVGGTRLIDNLTLEIP